LSDAPHFISNLLQRFAHWILGSSKFKTFWHSRTISMLLYNRGCIFHISVELSLSVVRRISALDIKPACDRKTDRQTDGRTDEFAVAITALQHEWQHTARRSKQQYFVFFGGAAAREFGGQRINFGHNLPRPSNCYKPVTYRCADRLTRVTDMTVLDTSSFRSVWHAFELYSSCTNSWNVAENKTVPATQRSSRSYAKF